MTEAFRGEPTRDGMHSSCHDSEGCCEEPCGPVFRSEKAVEESSNGKLKDHKSLRAAKLIVREISSGSYFIDPERGLSSRSLFVFPEEAAPEAE